MNDKSSIFSTFKGNSVAKRQASGNSGQSLTEGILGRHFGVCKRNYDVDGADHWIGLLDSDNNPLAVWLRVQSKSRDRGNRATFTAAHASTPTGRLRTDFFAFIHVDEGHELLFYILDAGQILALPRDKDGHPYFDTSNPGIEPSTRPDAVARLNAELQRMISVEDEQRRRAQANEVLLSDMSLAHDLRNRNLSNRPKFTYLLNWWKRSVDVDDDAIALIVSVNSETKERRPIDARLDLFATPDTFGWGATGSGSKMTAWSILAHHLARTPTSDEVNLFIQYALVDLEPYSDYEISTDEIAAALMKRRALYRRLMLEGIASAKDRQP
ncbi:DUF6166 domain-containing protein [Rhizobium ruizarguesonis]|uniref:DUF6166 domain-containing protein n=1 Tax=Rhizobium ruizarguesonis TaxID=2081791 RepID=UPI0010313322|nr:DUF6166 domain-containing protein [Rhizobium ruizarguesonis]TBC98791.1 hypothetical protein ELH25_08860 [Rhizobium ruizarguesonis]TBD15626.1 hypothetical protein ELH24_08815 [Rhizobium ruizarguesonis]TBE96657.1 hypothetical protein ELG98_08670 [Rhizobium ruizarguesonis]